MTMGQRILAARQAAGLSQRELAGEEITRNMLSALEHDNANPSIATLYHLAGRLGKSVSYFLGEETAEGWQVLEAARGAFEAGEFSRCRELLTGKPGEVLAGEWAFLRKLATLREAEQTLAQNRPARAGELLGMLERQKSRYFPPELERTAQILRAKLGLSGEIPEPDTLLLKAELANDPRDAERYLLALDDRDGDWHARMGEALFQQSRWREAADHFHQAEQSHDLRSRLEICYRELGDYKMAYHYARL